MPRWGRRACTRSPPGEEQHQWGGASCLVRGSCRRQGGGGVGPTWYSRPSGEKVVVRESYRRLPMVVCRPGTHAEAIGGRRARLFQLSDRRARLLSMRGEC